MRYALIVGTLGFIAIVVALLYAVCTFLINTFGFIGWIITAVVVTAIVVFVIWIIHECIGDSRK